MKFADRLRSAGFHERYQRLEFPFLRAEDEESEDSGLEVEESEEDGLTLRGQAVPFDTPTRIDNWFEGTFDEQFRKGAFKRTIKHGHQVMLFEHGHHNLFGTLPVAGVRRLEELDSGLDFTARAYNNWLTEPLWDAVRDRAVTGVSINFRPLQEVVTERDDDVPLVEVTEAELREFGPVLFPAYKETNVELRGQFEENVRRGLVEALKVYDGGSEGGALKREPASSGVAHLARTRLSLAERRLRVLEVTQ